MSKKEDSSKMGKNCIFYLKSRRDILDICTIYNEEKRLTKFTLTGYVEVTRYNRKHGVTYLACLVIRYQNRDCVG